MPSKKPPAPKGAKKKASSSDEPAKPKKAKARAAKAPRSWRWMLVRESVPFVLGAPHVPGRQLEQRAADLSVELGRTTAMAMGVSTTATALLVISSVSITARR